MPTPNDIRNQVETRAAIANQQRTITARLDRLGIVSPARRSRARANGYRGVLTRHELAKRVSANA